MRYKKVFPQTSLKTVDVLAAKGAFNVGCQVSDGKLTPTVNTVTTTTLFSGFETGAWYLPTVKKYILCTTGHVYYSDGSMKTGLNVSFPTENPSVVVTHTKDRNVISVISGNSRMSVVNDERSIASFGGGVRECILKNGRIFGVDSANPYKIKWSVEGGLDGWTDTIESSGWVAVQYGQGEILNLIVYKDKIVVVREHGLTFLTAYGTPENFKLGYLEYTLPKIYANTARIVGGDLVFYTEDGLYFYDGNKAEKCRLGLAEELQSATFAAANKGQYYLCGVSKTLQRNVILVFNSILNTAYIIDVPAVMAAVGEELIVYANRREYCLGEGGEYAFTSGDLDFSSDGNKVLKEIKILGGNDVQVEVSNGVTSRIVRGVRGKFRPHMRGKCFRITVRGTSKIDGISAVAEVRNEV